MPSGRPPTRYFSPSERDDLVVAVGVGQRQTTDDDQRRQRGDERRDAELGDDEPVGQADRRAAASASRPSRRAAACPPMIALQHTTPARETVSRSTGRTRPSPGRTSSPGRGSRRWPRRRARSRCSPPDRNADRWRRRSPGAAGPRTTASTSGELTGLRVTDVGACSMAVVSSRLSPSEKIDGRPVVAQAASTFSSVRSMRPVRWPDDLPPTGHRGRRPGR